MVLNWRDQISVRITRGFLSGTVLPSLPASHPNHFSPAGGSPLSTQVVRCRLRVGLRRRHEHDECGITAAVAVATTSIAIAATAIAVTAAAAANAAALAIQAQPSSTRETLSERWPASAPDLGRPLCPGYGAVFRNRLGEG